LSFDSSWQLPVSPGCMFLSGVASDPCTICLMYNMFHLALCWEMWGETICSSIQQAPQKIEQIEFAAILADSSYIPIYIYIGLLTKKDSTQSQIPCMENVHNNYQTRTIIFLRICSKKRGLSTARCQGPFLGPSDPCFLDWASGLADLTCPDQHCLVVQSQIYIPNQKDRQTKILQAFWLQENNHK
jgi:hypothetical protein